MIFNIIITTILVLIILFITYKFSNNIKKLQESESKLQESVSKLQKRIVEHKESIVKVQDSIAKLQESITEQKELNKYFTQNQSKTDIALINLIDIPFITNELDPGYPKEWDGKVPYQMNEAFIGSEIKAKYFYTIDSIKDDWVKISRK